jgi:hypothetical protein
MMPQHSCIDPQDPYAQLEVLIVFECGPFGIHLVSALDEWNVDVLPDLVEEQRRDLQCEIAVYYSFRDPPALADDGGFGSGVHP